jgi:hypothetical protein
MTLAPPSLPPTAPKPPQKAVAITGPLSTGDLMDRVFLFLRARFAVLMLTAGVILVPIGALSALLTGNFMTGYWELLQFSVTPGSVSESELVDLFSNAATAFAGLLLFGFLTMLGANIITLATVYHVERFLQSEASTLGAGLRAALRRFWPMLGMQIVQALVIGLATLVILLVIGIILFLVIVVFGLLSAGTFDADMGALGIFLAIMVVIAVVVGYVAFIILAFAPTAYFSARWVAAAPAIMLERLGPVAALRRSWGLTQGNIWRCIGFVLLLTLFSSLVIGLPLAVAQQIAVILVPSQITLIAMISTIGGYLASILYRPIYATGVAMLYYDLRVRREAYDVALRVTALEAEVAQDAPPV